MKVDRLRSIGRRDWFKILGGAVGSVAFGGAAWSVGADANKEREQERLELREQLSGFKYEVRVPRVGSVSGIVSLAPPVAEPSRLVVEIDVFLVKDKPRTIIDVAGVTRMILEGEVLRYDPWIIKRPPFPYEELPGYEIINPQNVGIIPRLPQE